MTSRVHFAEKIRGQHDRDASSQGVRCQVNGERRKRARAQPAGDVAGGWVRNPRRFLDDERERRSRRPRGDCEAVRRSGLATELQTRDSPPKCPRLFDHGGTGLELLTPHACPHLPTPRGSSRSADCYHTWLGGSHRVMSRLRLHPLQGRATHEPLRNEPYCELSQRIRFRSRRCRRL